MSERQMEERNIHAPVRSRLAPVPLALAFVLTATLAGCDTSPGELAKCDSSDAKDLVQQAIEENPDSPQVKIKVLDISNVKEVSYDDKKPERVCTASLELNAGQINVQYRLWYNSDKTKLLTRVWRVDDGGSGGDGQ